MEARLLSDPLATTAEGAVTDLDGRPGAFGETALATDGEYVYFTWLVDVGDIWVADVVGAR